MNQTIRNFSDCAAAWLLALAVTGSPWAADSTAERLRSYLRSTHSLVADFTQVTVDEAGNQDPPSKGVFSLQRPGKFRWDYTEPYAQEIVSNGDKVWFFDADLEQVTVKRLDEAIGSTPALLLSGDMTLEENFTLEGLGSGRIKLSPKSGDSSFTQIILGFDEQVLKSMELSDKFGQTTRVSFSNIRANQRLEAARFEFRPPKGVDVFED